MSISHLDKRRTELHRGHQGVKGALTNHADSSTTLALSESGTLKQALTGVLGCLDGTAQYPAETGQDRLECLRLTTVERCGEIKLAAARAWSEQTVVTVLRTVGMMDGVDERFSGRQAGAHGVSDSLPGRKLRLVRYRGEAKTTFVRQPPSSCFVLPWMFWMPSCSNLGKC